MGEVAIVKEYHIKLFSIHLLPILASPINRETENHMNIESEKKILNLARKLGNVNRKIIKSVAEKGATDSALNKDYYSLRDELKKLLGQRLKHKKGYP